MLQNYCRDLLSSLEGMYEPEREVLQKGSAFQKLVVQLLEEAILVHEKEK
ncbi:hypothetical protein [Allobaculum sp. JKK-2023]|nr:hypothetical protein [Allobaculum sp. JKK-2023]